MRTLTEALDDSLINESALTIQDFKKVDKAIEAKFDQYSQKNYGKFGLKQFGDKEKEVLRQTALYCNEACKSMLEDGEEEDIEMYLEDAAENISDQHSEFYDDDFNYDELSKIGVEMYQEFFAEITHKSL